VQQASTIGQPVEVFTKTIHAGLDILVRFLKACPMLFLEPVSVEAWSCANHSVAQPQVLVKISAFFDTQAVEKTRPMNHSQ